MGKAGFQFSIFIFVGVGVVAAATMLRDIILFNEGLRSS